MILNRGVGDYSSILVMSKINIHDKIEMYNDYKSKCSIIGIKPLYANIDLMSEDMIVISKNINADTVIIPKCADVIGAFAFIDHTNLKGINISSDIKVIERRAFKGCEGLEKIKFNGNVDMICDEIIDGCSNLREIGLNNVVHIGNKAFKGSKLEKVIIGDTVKSIGIEAFANIGSLTEVEFGNSVKIIKGRAFMGTPIKRIELKEGLEEIRDKAFMFCSDLEYISIPDSVKYISDDVFEGVSSEVTIDCSDRIMEMVKKSLYSEEDILDRLL